MCRRGPKIANQAKADCSRLSERRAPSLDWFGGYSEMSEASARP